MRTQGPSGFHASVCSLGNTRAQAVSLALARPWEVALDLSHPPCHPTLPAPPALLRRPPAPILPDDSGLPDQAASDAIISQDIQVHLSLQDQSAHGLVGS